LSQTIREIAHKEGGTPGAPGGKAYRAAHIGRNMKVFVNPMVASLPQHAHLFPSHGCFKQYGPDRLNPITRPCNGELESELPKEFHPLELTPAMDEEWKVLIESHLQPNKQKS
jgi:hypothetical protein